MKFSELNLITDQSVTEVTFNNQTFNVYNYLPTRDKANLIEITLQESYEPEGWYNPIKLDWFFYANIVMVYTDIEFDPEDETDLAEFYDKVKTSGLLAKIIKAIPKKEYDELFKMMEDMLAARQKLESSIVNKIITFLKSAPEEMQKLNEIVKDFDKEKYQEVMRFAKAANGGREIS